MDCSPTPFMRAEIEWLLSNRRCITVLYGAEEACELSSCCIDLLGPLSTTPSSEVGVRASTGASYVPRGVLRVDLGAGHVSKNELVRDLTGRYGTSVTTPSSWVIDFCDSNVLANTVLLDVRSFFLLVKRRNCGDVNDSRSKTLAFLADIEQFYHRRKLLFESYLCGSLINLELDSLITEYEDGLSPERTVAVRCEAYLSALREAVNYMR